MRSLRGAAATFASLAILAACTQAPDASEPGEVVVYTSVDQHFSEPVLDAFEAATGIRVRPVFDVEASKTTGLVNRLLAERDRPAADVWWNGEFAQTIDLARDGVFAPYRSAAGADIPARYVDSEGLWTGFGGRARVFIVNTDRLAAEDYPSSVSELEDLDDPTRAGMALPVFGTTATHAAALYEILGPEGARAFFSALKESGLQIVDGNSVVRDMVASGALDLGLTDTDDACGALGRDQPVAVVFPDQEPGGLGTLIVPNTVALVEGAPHPDQGKAFIDYLLSRKTVAGMVEDGWFQVTLRDIDAANPCIDASGVKGMDVPLTTIADNIDQAIGDLTTLFIEE